MSGPSGRQVGETRYTGDVRSSAVNVRHGSRAHSQQSPYSEVDEVPETQMISVVHRPQGLALSRSLDYEFEVGREVDMPVWTGVTPWDKFGSGWTGPYLVIKVISNLVYEIQLSRKSKPKVVHADNLKTCPVDPDIVSS